MSADESPGSGGITPAPRLLTAGLVVVILAAFGAIAYALLSGSDDPSAAPAQSSAPFVSTAAPTSRSMPALTPQRARELLLVPADLGADFDISDYTPAPAAPLCPAGATTPLDTAIPPTVLAGAQLDSPATEVRVREDLRQYADAAATTKAYDAAVASLNCMTAPKTTIADDGEAGFAVDAERAKVWTITTDGVPEVQIYAQLGTALVSVTMRSTKDELELIDVTTVAGKAVKRLRAA